MSFPSPSFPHYVYAATTNNLCSCLTPHWVGSRSHLPQLPYLLAASLFECPCSNHFQCWRYPHPRRTPTGTKMLKLLERGNYPPPGSPLRMEHNISTELWHLPPQLLPVPAPNLFAKFGPTPKHPPQESLHSYQNILFFITHLRCRSSSACGVSRHSLLVLLFFSC